MICELQGGIQASHLYSVQSPDIYGLWPRLNTQRQKFPFLRNCGRNFVRNVYTNTAHVFRYIRSIAMGRARIRRRIVAIYVHKTHSCTECIPVVLTVCGVNDITAERCLENYVPS
jgi:hypothetical protein